MTNPNHPAFGHGDMDHCEGLTKREYFAALAMQGLSADPTNDMPEGMASFAVKLADALIAELNKEQEAKPASNEAPI